jgi:hypothetical protein
MQHAKRSGNCVRRSWNDWPKGNLNLNLILGIKNTLGSADNVWTRIQNLEIFVICTLVLFVKPLRAIFRMTIQISPILSFRVCGGTPLSLKLFNTSTVSMSRSIFFGSSTSHKWSAEHKKSIWLLFLFWMISFHWSTCSFVAIKYNVKKDSYNESY